jgi:ribonucleoside-diphosphate reductase alpha chain
MNVMHVKKRDGRLEKVCFNKITRRIERLCHKLDPVFIDPVKITIKVSNGLFNGVATFKLDNLASEICASLSTSHPDFGTLAARIFVSNLHKRCDKSFSNCVKQLEMNKNPVTGQDMPLVSNSFRDDVMFNSHELDKAIDHSKDYTYSYFGLKTLEKAYLLRIGEEIVETPQFMLMRVAVTLHGRDLSKILETYTAMSERHFIHATPTLFNAGTKRAGLSSCFLLSLSREDDSIKGIYRLLGECAEISKYSGGIGISIHDIRAKGSLIMSTNGKSEGIIPMLGVFNKSVKYVTQSNKRPGSVAVYIEPWHAEISEFLKLKENSGIEELRARDLFYGMWIPDLFMKKVKDDLEWHLFCPNQAPGLADVFGQDFNDLYEKYVSQGLYVKKVQARKIMFEMIESQIKTGGPYVLFKDAVNKKNNQKHIGTIRSSNLCTEITLHTDSDSVAVCNLASLGLPSFVKDEKSFDFAALHKNAKIVTKNVDRLIDVTHYPIEKSRVTNLRHRPLGIGVSGLADVFMMLKMPYESEEARDLNIAIFETIYHAAIEASCELAESHGSYDTYQGSEFSKGIFQWDMWDDVTHSGMWDWNKLRDSVLTHGMRNSMLTAVMPTASTSQIIGNTESMEPINSNIYKRQTLSGEFQIVNKHLLRELCSMGLWNDAMKQRIISNKGSVQNIEEIPENIKSVFKTSWEISQRSIIDMSVDRAPYIDHSQSLNVFMSEPTYKKLMSLHFYAHERGLKTGMYYLKMKAATAPIQISCSIENKECVSCSA